MTKSRFLALSRGLSLAVLVTLFALAWRGPLDTWFNDAALGELNAANELYLEQSFDDASHLFLGLTALKSALAVVEGSEVGVGFGLELGDVVQGVYDYVDFAWQIVLWSTLVIVMTRMALEVAQFADQWLLVLALGSTMLYLVAAWWLPRQRAIARVLRDLSFFSVVLAAAAYFIAPLAVAGGAALSAEITAARVSEAGQRLSGVSAELDGRLAAIENADGILGKARKISEAKDAFVGYVQAKSAQLFWDLVTISAAFLFDTVVFPLGLFLLMFWLTRLLGRYLYGLRRGQALREDLDALFARYWAKAEARDAG